MLTFKIQNTYLSNGLSPVKNSGCTTVLELLPNFLWTVWTGWNPTDVNKFAHGANFIQDVNKSLGSQVGATTQVCW